MSQSPGYQTAMAPRPLQNQAPQQSETGGAQNAHGQQPPAQQQQQSRTSSITSIQLCQMATELISEIVSRTTERKLALWNIFTSSLFQSVRSFELSKFQQVQKWQSMCQ